MTSPTPEEAAPPASRSGMDIPAGRTAAPRGRHGPARNIVGAAGLDAPCQDRTMGLFSPMLCTAATSGI